MTYDNEPSLEQIKRQNKFFLGVLLISTSQRILGDVTILQQRGIL